MTTRTTAAAVVADDYQPDDPPQPVPVSDTFLADFAQSPYKKEAEAVLQREIARIHNECDLEFNAQNEEYKRNISKRNDAIRKFENEKQHVEHLALTVKYAFTLKSAVDQLLTKLRQALLLCPALLRKVQGNIRVPATREVLNNPFALEGVPALCGIFLILFKEFMKPQLATFTRQMLHLDSVKFNRARCDNDIEGIFREFGEIITHWRQSELFQCMTLDNFLTMHFLIAIDRESELRAECMKSITKYMREKETAILLLTDDDDSFDADKTKLLTYPDMPMYSDMYDNVKSIVVQRKELEQETDRHTVETQSLPAGAQKDINRPKSNNNYTRYTKPAAEKGLEMAMNAATAPVGKTLPSRTIPPLYLRVIKWCRLNFLGK